MKKKTVAGLVSLGLFWTFISTAQENNRGKEQTTSQSNQSTGQSTAPPASKKDQEEYYEVPSPFGIQRYPKRPGGGAPPVATPQNTVNPQAPLTPAATPAGPAQQGSTPEPAPSPQQGSQPGQTPVSPSPAPTYASAPVKLLFDKADLLQVVNVIANDLLRLNYIVAPGVKGVVTINTAGEFHREDLFPLLEQILKLNNCAIFKSGNIYQISPAKDIKQFPIPVRSPEDSGKFKEDDLMIMQVLPMRFVAASEMSKILAPYLSESGNIMAHTQGNILIITESASNLKKLLDLVNIFDADVFRNRRVKLYPIKNNRARNIRTDLETVFAAYSLSSKESAVRFIAVDRINSILAISSNPSSFGDVDKWVEKLDQTVENAGVRNYFYKVENGEAKQIANLLLRVYGRKTTEKEEKDQTPFPAPPGIAPAAATPEAEKPPEDKSVAGYIQGEIKIVPDEINNGLIVQCSPQDYETIKETIKELDRVPRQVLIDAKIYEVTLSGALSFGVSAFLKQQTTDPHLTTGSFVGSTGSGSSPGSGTVANALSGLSLNTFALIGNTRELLVFLNAQETQSKTKVLSAPSIIAADNQEAKIQVGTEVPLLSSQGVVPGGSVGGTSLFSNTISNRPTGIILTVTPRINPTGWVTMKLSQEVSSPIAPTLTSAIQSPSISIRSVNTQVTVKDGETIAIGGIIAENKLTSKNRIPVLGNIPGAGYLFGSTSTTTQRTELIALITPHMIQDIDSAADTTDELKSRLKDLKKDLQRMDQGN
ncbi:MAG: type II secretion system secretin GspD [Terriglobia bacterium]